MLSRRVLLTLPVTLLTAVDTVCAADLRKKTLDAWQAYVQLTEERISAELERGQGFLVRDFKGPSEAAGIRAIIASGKPYIAKMQTRNQANNEIKIQDGIVHHRYGSIFIPGARIVDVLSWVQNFDQYHVYFAEVEKSKLLSRNGDKFDVFMRLIRTKIGITVHYNTDYTFTFRRHDDARTSGSMIATRIALVRQIVCASPTYLKRRGTPKTPSDLSSHDCVAYEGISSAMKWGLVIDGRLNAIAVPSRLFVNTPEAALVLALAGAGIARVPSYQLTDHVKSRSLVTLLEDFEPPPTPVHAIYPAQRQVPQKLRAFLEFCVPRLRETLGYKGS